MWRHFMTWCWLSAFVRPTYSLLTFTPGAFVIRRQVGQLGFATETEWQYDGQAPRNPLDPSTPKRTIEASGVSVRLFDAQLDDGTRVLLKEFIGESVSIGENELDLYELLNSREAAAQASRGMQSPYVGSLIGRMRADSTFASAAFRAEWCRALPSTPPPGTDGLWLVFRWDGLRTLAGFASQPQERGFFDWDGKDAEAQRRAFIKRTCAQTLETISWLHGQGVVHRSLGSSSLLLSTYDQREKPRVKCIDLGFAATAARLSTDDVSAAMARGASGPLDVIPFCTRADDLHALAYVFLELILCGSAASAPDADVSLQTRSADLQSLKRLIEDVFVGDVCSRFRQYCMEESEWADAVILLDEEEGAGWKLVQSLVDCGLYPSSDAVKPITARSLLTSSWFNSIQ